MTTTTLLLIALIIYIIGIVLAYITKTKWLIAIIGIVWFIPIIEVNNTFITVISSAMLLIHIYLGMFTNKEEDY